MTVCVALVCDNMPPDRPCIIGAADAMVSLQTLLATPPGTKSVSVYGSTAIMFAGNVDLHSEILQAMIPAIGTQPELSVVQIAELYAATYRAVRSKRAAADVLGNYGMDLPTFLKRKPVLRNEVVDYLAARLDAYRFVDEEDVAVIVAGITASGAHIWMVQAGQTSCADGQGVGQGYAAIGMGAEHALSFLMRSSYDARMPLPEAMLMAFIAKRHGERAPYVGERTDLFTIGPALRSFRHRANDVTDALDARYREWQASEQEGLLKARAAMNEMANRYAAQGRSL